jgi:hypothetical protein
MQAWVSSREIADQERRCLHHGGVAEFLEKRRYD